MSSVVFALMSGYSFTKGIIYDVVVPESFTFGDTIDISSKALFSRVTYEYRSQGEDEWTYEVPLRAGVYEVRISSKETFGSINESIYTFEIKPKLIDVNLLSDQVQFGDDPSLNIELYQGDYIDEVMFIYEDLSSLQTIIDIDYIIIRDINGVDVTSSYIFELKTTDITFIARNLTIKPLDVNKTYDGTLLSSDVFEIVEGSLIDGHQLVITTNQSILEVGQIQNDIINYHVFDGDIDVTANYNITTLPGQLEITTRLLTIETDAASKTYDGLELFNLGYQITEGSLSDLETITINDFNSIIEVGSIENYLDVSIYNHEGFDVTTNYDITIITNDLEVIPRLITIQTNSDQIVFDGQALINTNYQMTDGSLLNNHHTSLISSVSLLEVGTTLNELTVGIFDENDLNISHNYEITYVYGTLEVTKRPMTIETASDEKVYDGTFLSNQNYQITFGTLVYQNEITVINDTQITNVGTIDNHLEISIMFGTIDYTHNYEITYIEGLLEISVKSITISSASDQKIYDGLELFNTDTFVTSGSLVELHEINVLTYATITNVGVIENEIAVKIVDQLNVDLTSNYDITYVFQTLEITKRAITVETATDEKIYDGTPLFNQTMTITIGSLVDQHNLNVLSYEEIINVGNIDNVLDINIIDNQQNDITYNYDISVVEGQLSIVKRDITIQTTHATKIYDGTPLYELGHIISVGSLVGGDTTIVNQYSQIINVGVIDNELSISIYNSEQLDNTYNYQITYLYETLEVTKRAITFSTGSSEQIYNGEKLFDTSYVLISGDLVLDHMPTLLSYVELLNVDIVDNVLNINIIDGNNQNVSQNYLISYDYGTLEVTPRQLSITTASDQKVYDGSALYNQNYFVSSGIIVPGDTFVIIDSSHYSDVGIYDNNIIFNVFNVLNEDITTNYQLTYVYGSLEITPRSVEFLSSSDTHIYDGLPFYNVQVTVTNGSLVSGHSTSVTNYQSIIDVGTTSNIISLVILDGELNDVTTNYEISYVYGVLEVTPRNITIQTSSSSHEYDGQIYYDEYAYVITSSTVLDHSIHTLTHSEMINVGTMSNVLTVQILDGQLVDVTYNYSITYSYGTLEITPRQITIQTSSDRKAYDGTPLFNTNIVITRSNLVLDHYTSVISYTEIINIGQVSNVLDIEILDGNNQNVSYNYEITYDLGSLEIVPRAITILTSSASKEYDGQAIYNTDFELSLGTLLDGDTLSLVSYNTFINAGTYDNDLVVTVVNNLDQDVSYNYIISYEYSKIVITPRPITISTASESKEYDGIELFNEGFEITSGSLLSNHLIDVTDHISIINVESVDNVLTFIIYNDLFETMTHNYEISYVLGTLEIYSYDLTIKPLDEEKMYDGTALYGNTAEIVTGILPIGYYIVITTDGSIINVGTSNNDILSAIIYSDQDQNMTSYYNLTFETGLLTITPRTIDVQPNYATKVYDGEPLTSNIVSSMGTYDLIGNHTLVATTDGSQTEVGSSLNNITSLTILDGSVDVTNNYDITYLAGTLRVTYRTLTIETASASKIYDGEPLFDATYQIIAGSLADGDYIEVLTYSELTDVDIIDNVFTIQILNSLGEDVTSVYNIIYRNGYLEVKPITITISTPNDSKVYDGTPLTNTNWELTNGTLMTNHTLNVTVTGTITEVGKAFNYFNYEILDSNNINVSNLYTVINNIGTLEILSNLQTITIQSESDSKVYDGTPLTNDQWLLTDGELLIDHQLYVDVTGTITEIGYVVNAFTYYILDGNNQDVTDLYLVSPIYGRLTILDANDNGTNTSDNTNISNEGTYPPDSTLSQPLFQIYTSMTDMVYLRDKSYGDYNKTGFDAPVVYDSPYGISPLSFAGLAINNSLSSSIVQIKALTTGLSYYLPYYATDGFYDNTNDIYASYQYAQTYSVSYVPISFVNYNNYSLNNTSYDTYESIYNQFVYEQYLALPEETRIALLDIANSNGLNPANQSIITDVQNYIQNAAIYNLYYQPIPSNVDYALYFLQVSREGICQHFAMAATVMYRALGIPARYVTGFAQYAESDTWTDVTPMQAHAWVEVYITGFGWVPVEVTAGGPEGSATNGGTQINDGTTQKEVIEITSANDSKTYDGIALTNNNYTYTGTLQNGHTLFVDVTGTITNVGTENNVFTAAIFDSGGADVSSQYTISPIYGSLVVVPNNDKTNIEIQLFNNVVVYDGLSHTLDPTEYWIPSNNLPSGYQISFDIVGQITNAGKIAVAIDKTTVKIIDQNHIDVTDQFNIITYNGSIEVVKRNITLTLFTVQKYYDGEPLTSDLFYISQGSLVSGDQIVITANGTITDIGTQTNSISSVTITNNTDQLVTSNYNITAIDGSLIVLAE